MDRATAQAHLHANDHPGWTHLLDVLYDNLPEGIVITEVFQKWGGLKISFHGEHELFEELADSIYHVSQYLCEICGASAKSCILDGWETTLCLAHYEAAAGKQKYRD
jgi:hypothetical protein